jgi:pimeloyl-ACP methyl ester carboxylesterase
MDTGSPDSQYQLNKRLVDYLLFEFDARELVTTYEVPVYLITGEYDSTTPLTLTREYYELVDAPSKKLIEVEGVGHYLYGDNPEIFTQAVLDNVELYVQPPSLPFAESTRLDPASSAG